MADLIQVDGEYRCKPNKLCRAGDEMVVCRVHNRKRVRVQMDEVSPGIFECKQGSLCFVAQPGRPVEVPRPAPTTAPAPAFPASGHTPHIPAAQSRIEVWCCLHGTRLPHHLCEMMEGTFYVCKEASRCLMTELEPPAALHNKHSPPILCRTHMRLRDPGFMVLKGDKSGYECAPGHTCTTFGRSQQ